MAKTDLGVGFPQKYNEAPAKLQDLNPDAVVDLVSEESTKPVRATAKVAKPATVAKVSKQSRASKKK